MLGVHMSAPRWEIVNQSVLLTEAKNSEGSSLVSVAGQKYHFLQKTLCLFQQRRLMIGKGLFAS